MKIIIITDKPLGVQVPAELAKIINVHDFANDTSSTWDHYTNEYIPYRICESVEGSDLVIGVDFSISQPIDKYLIAHHLISSKKGTVFLFTNDENVPLQLEDDMGLFRNKAIKLISKEKLTDILTNDKEAENYSLIYNNDFDFSKYEENYSRFIVVDRHQITNEWGATKLLLNHGLSLAEIESEFVLPKTIYFKNKLAEHSIDNSFIANISGNPNEIKINDAKAKFAQNALLINKILLIDDNASKGWEFALRKIFFQATIETKFNYEECLTITDFSVYDVIFLDLRLPTNITNDRLPRIQNGFKLIAKIKDDENSLHVPVVIFTASQKASTLNDVIEKGADAMYVKESPDLSPSESLNNYLDFLNTINNQIEKGLQLKRYWNAVRRIKNEFLPEVINTGTVILKDRIVERLEMFYGLMKKKHEQSSYNDTQFHFSSDILSFITLWSMLNEIQECYYEKIKNQLNIFFNRTSQTYNPLKKAGGSVFEYINKWHIRNQPNDVFLEKTNIALKLKTNGGFRTDNNGDYLLDCDTNCFLSYSSGTSPFYSTSKSTNGTYSKGNAYHPERTLSLQIAFLLLEKTELKTSAKLNDFLRILKTANEQRNKLYITHGEDVDTTFHYQKERNKRLPTNATLNLFSLISFLLTGNDSIV